MRELSDEEMGAVSGAEGFPTCRALTWWDRQKLSIIAWVFDQATADRAAYGWTTGGS